MLSGTIFDIKRYAIHDGPGIRTTVFLKGCPLSCGWCHNPESWQQDPQLSVRVKRCSGCGRCFDVLPYNRSGLDKIKRLGSDPSGSRDFGPTDDAHVDRVVAQFKQKGVDVKVGG